MNDKYRFLNDKPLDHYPAAIYLFVILWAAFGGLVRRLQKINDSKVKLSFKELYSIIIIDMVISSFCGMLVFFICIGIDLPLWITGGFVGMAGHMGSRALFLLEKVITKKVVQ